MNLVGVTQTAQIFPQDMPQMPERLPESLSGADAINTSMMASVQVLDMAQSSFEDAAMQLVQSMMTGLGQNVDVYA